MRWKRAPRPCWPRSTWKIRTRCSGPACTRPPSSMSRMEAPVPRRSELLTGVAVVAASLLIHGAAFAQSAAVPPSKAQEPQSAAGVQPIDLPTTLKLAGANNLDLALTREALVQAEAQNDAATLGFLPDLVGGVGYYKHNGAIQDVSGNV